MDDEPLNYEKWVEEALRTVIKRALKETELNGLPEDHHFFITFLTCNEGVEIPSQLKAEHPREMTIVLQHQFNNLLVTDVGFSVSLSFKGRACQLSIPFASVIAFADPAINFALQLKIAKNGRDENKKNIVSTPKAAEFVPKPSGQEKIEELTPECDVKNSEIDQISMGEIITLDKFRKK